MIASSALSTCIRRSALLAITLFLSLSFVSACAAQEQNAESSSKGHENPEANSEFIDLVIDSIECENSLHFQDDIYHFSTLQGIVCELPDSGFAYMYEFPDLESFLLNADLLLSVSTLESANYIGDYWFVVLPQSKRISEEILLQAPRYKEISYDEVSRILMPRQDAAASELDFCVGWFSTTFAELVTQGPNSLRLQEDSETLYPGALDPIMNELAPDAESADAWRMLMRGNQLEFQAELSKQMRPIKQSCRELAPAVAQTLN